MYEVRFYREWVKGTAWVSFEAVCRESDLMVSACRDLRAQAEELLRRIRGRIEDQIARQPEFVESLSPLPMPPDASPVVRVMIKAGRTYDVGPMAAVAGAVAQFVGEGLLRWSPEIIVENGGDIFMKTTGPVRIGLYAGADSPFSGEMCLRVNPAGGALGVCTSSGTVGHSLSFGRGDAVVTVAGSAALADAAATSIGNRIASDEDIKRVLREEKARGLLKGLLIAVGEKVGAYGEIELTGSARCPADAEPAVRGHPEDQE